MAARSSRNTLRTSPPQTRRTPPPSAPHSASHTTHAAAPEAIPPLPPTTPPADPHPADPTPSFTLPNSSSDNRRFVANPSSGLFNRLSGCSSFFGNDCNHSQVHLRSPSTNRRYCAMQKCDPSAVSGLKTEAATVSFACRRSFSDFGIEPNPINLTPNRPRTPKPQPHFS